MEAAQRMTSRPDPDDYPLCRITPDGKLFTQDGDAVPLTELVVAYNDLVIEMFCPGGKAAFDAGQEFRGLVTGNQRQP